MKTILLLLLALSLYGEEISTNTITAPSVTPSTYSVLLEKVIDHVITKSGKIIAIDILLNDSEYYEGIVGVPITKKEGQDLLNLKTILSVEDKHEKQNRNYIGGVTYPVYKKKQ